MGTAGADSVGISIVGGGLYTYKNSSRICAGGIKVDGGDIRFESGSVTVKGSIFAETGIYIGEKLTVSTPAGGTVTEVTVIDGSYYTIVEKDGSTVADQIEIKPLSYTVRINAENNTITVLVPAGQSVNEALGIEDFSETVNVAKKGYIFDGWYTDEAYTEAFDFDMAVTANITLYGKWTPITCTVTYVADGKVVATVTVEYGKDAAAPELPAKRGYTAAWDQDGKHITADTTITAVYTRIPDAPNIPNKPNIPNIPNTPDIPDIPNMPDIPDTPNKPNIPDAPNISDTHGTTDTPDTTNIPDTPVITEIPDTGDKDNIEQWFALLCISGGALMILLAYGRKKRLIK